ncbi:MAG TPA: peptidoglycan-binding protein [Actinopolymorphaceae bacterium]
MCGKSGAVFWKADMDIDCDGKRTTQCNKNTDPWFLPETACVESDGEYLDSAGLPFVVVPLPDSRWDHTTANIRCGTVVAVVYQDKVVYGVVGDKGPRGIIGEGSYELAERLGINPDPRVGGVGGRVVDYIFFPGTVASPLEDQAQARSKGEAAATAFVDSTPTCADVGLDFTSYATIQVGSSGDLVKAAQCLLRTAGFDPGTMAGTFDATTESKVRAFQQSKGLPVDGVVARATWTALLSQGSTPTLRNGSTGADVRRLQRSLTAALGRAVGIDGQFGPLTERAVEDYQSSRDLDVDGVVGRLTWGALQAGR